MYPGLRTGLSNLAPPGLNAEFITQQNDRSIQSAFQGERGDTCLRHDLKGTYDTAEQFIEAGNADAEILDWRSRD
jgi:hypothetical protein